MCGILGIAAAGSAPPEAVLDGVALLRHRGPDAEGRVVTGGAGLAMRRLAIIDLDTGDQPVWNETRDVVCVCNGEIYNYVELRRELEARGHRLSTRGDVETIVHLYEDEGEACFARLRGMFAVALWDARRGRLVLARDRFGIKPLYLADLPAGLAFSSEIEPLLAAGADASVDPQAVADYLALGYVPGTATGRRGVRALAPGTALVVDGEARTERAYWQLAPPAGPAPLADTIAEAVRIHLRADVPLAVLLSGGLDSSLIAALAAEALGEPPHTFTVAFDDPALDESAPARAIARALGSRHEELRVAPSLAADLPEIAARLEEPNADPAAVPLWYLCRAVGSRVKVALAGDGGDEVLGGYSRYAWDPRAARIASLLPTGALASLLEAVPGVRARAAGSATKDPVRRAVKLLRNASLPGPARYLSWFQILDGDARRELLRARVEPAERVFEALFAGAAPGLTELGRLQEVDVRSFLADDLLLKADRMSMAHSLELRVPFLDHEVVSRGLWLSDREKVDGVRTKVAVRRLVEERLGPEIARRPKQGFDVPLDRWLRGELRELAFDVVGRDDAGGLLDGAAARRRLERHDRGEVDAGPQVYALLMLGLWLRGRPGGGV